MIFVISENKLEQVQKKLKLYKEYFLNSLADDDKTRVFDTYIVIESEEFDEFGDYQPCFEYDYSDGRLYVSKEVRNKFSSLFGSDKTDSNEFFKNWFESRFNVRVEFLD